MSRYFSYSTDPMLQCSHCRVRGMQADFLDRMDSLREAVGFPLRVSSGYRCPQHNATVSSTGPDGPHTTGRAVDLAVSHWQAHKVLTAAVALGFTGIGVKQHGSGRFIHLDDLAPDVDRPRPTIWSYP